MDNTLDIDILDIDILNIDRFPNGLCIWDLFKGVADYFGMKIDWAMCRTCCVYFRIPDGDIGGLIQHLNKSWCKDYVRQEYGLPKTWLGVEMSYEGPLN